MNTNYLMHRFPNYGTCTPGGTQDAQSRLQLGWPFTHRNLRKDLKLMLKFEQSLVLLLSSSFSVCFLWIQSLVLHFIVKSDVCPKVCLCQIQRDSVELKASNWF